jgi:DnaJ-class molecular chaperone
MRDPYEVLGVAKNASAKDIKSAYRKLAKKHHPDQNPDDPKAKDRFAAANQAYEIAGRPGGDPFDGNSDIFSQIFGDTFSGARGAGSGDRRQPATAADLNVTLDVTIEEAATAEKVTAMFPDGRKVAVKLPAYVEDGQTIRLKGQGEQGPGQPGDALVKIHLRRHPRYRIEGRDLHADLPVALADAVLGAKVPVDTPTGRLAVNIPAWSSSDKVLRLKGRGLPEKAGGHGDLYAHVRIMLPEGGDSALEALLRGQKD